MKLENPQNDYPAIRMAAAKLLKGGHVFDILAASYSRLIVDEYQDCSVHQHGDRLLRRIGIAHDRVRRSNAGNLWLAGQ